MRLNYNEAIASRRRDLCGELALPSPLGTIVFCTAEAAPFAKVGGLGDVAGSLPKALAEAGLAPVVVMPRYGFIEKADLTPLDISFTVEVLGQHHPCSVWQSVLPQSTVPVYFIENETYFSHRQTVYPYGDPIQEVEGFMLLSQAVFPLVKALNIPLSILHAHDWHTAPAVVALASLREKDSTFQHVKSVLTVHNLAYHGNHHPNGCNWLAEGIAQADWVTTVSPTYAQEILTPAFGYGLEGLLHGKAQAGRLTGILNGIDTRLFDPATDHFIPEKYTAQTATTAKAQAKREVQLELNLPTRPDLPLIGMVTRLTEQKGLDLLLSMMDILATRQAQWAVIGTGEPGYETVLREYNQRYPHIKTYTHFNLALAQRVYAGSDLFLMPSRFEPCGLGQMIAMRYGAIPVARATGGLADSIIDVRTHPETGTGFLFHDYSPTAMLEAVDAALSAYACPAWGGIVQHAMAAEFTWTRSAQAYKTLYETLMG